MIKILLLPLLLLIPSCISFEEYTITNTRPQNIVSLDTSLQNLDLTISDAKTIESQLSGTLTRYKLLYYPEIDMKVLIVYDLSSARQFISFSPVLHYKSIQNAERYNMAQSPLGIMVNGYYSQMYSIMKQELFTEIWQDKSTIYVSGIGSGGVMATLFALDATLMRIQIQSLHTFGMTTFTDIAGAAVIDQTIGNISSNVLLENDLAIDTDIKGAIPYAKAFIITNNGTTIGQIIPSYKEYNGAALQLFYTDDPHKMIALYRIAIAKITGNAGVIRSAQRRPEHNTHTKEQVSQIVRRLSK